MSRDRSLEPDPLAKADNWQGGLWRAGSLFLGLLVLLELAAWLLGDFFDMGVSRFSILLLVGGLGLSVPYGLLWLNDRLPPDKRDEPLDVVARIHGTTEPDATYVFGIPEKKKKQNWLKREGPSDLGAVGYLLYSVFVKAPTYVGDAILVILWRAIGKVWGVRGTTGTRDLSLDAMQDPSRYSSPDEDTF